MMSMISSQITGVSNVCSTICSGVGQTSKLRVTSLCEGNPSVIGGFPSHRTSYAENVSIWWRHHEFRVLNNSNTTVTQQIFQDLDYLCEELVRNNYRIYTEMAVKYDINALEPIQLWYMTLWMHRLVRNRRWVSNYSDNLKLDWCLLCYFPNSSYDE